MIFVLDKNKKPLHPCHPAKARKLLRDKKAVVHRKHPFTIRLKEQRMAKDEKNIEEVGEQKQTEYRLKIDYGSRHTGLAILKNNEVVVWLAQLQHKTNIKSKLEKRSAHRRRRRSANLRYRKPRFENRKREKGWIPPSLQSRVDNIESWVKKLMNLCPLTHISYENVKFDTQLIMNPDIKGVEYQQGTLMGYEIREYLLEKFDRTCVYCGATDKPLEIEHTTPKSRGGSNRISNLAIACRDCNQSKGNQTAEEFGYPELQDKINEPLREVAIINATRWRVYEVLTSTGLPVECGTGARTKMNRIKMGLVKDHHYDACCVGRSTPSNLYFKTDNVLYIKAIGRGDYSRTNLDKFGFPRSYLPRKKHFFGFMSGDMVKAVVPKGKNEGVWHGSVACRSTGSFNINLRKGRIQGINHRYFQIVQRSDGYQYTIERREIEQPHSSHR